MKIALVTGGSRGLGKSMCLHLARKGRDIVLTYREKKAEAMAVAADIETLGRKAVALPLDVSRSADFPAFAQALGQALRETFGREDFDFLVNNAGYGVHAAFEATTEDQFDRMVAVHCKAAFFLTQALLPMIRDGGRVVNVSSGLTRFSYPGYAAYAAAKGAMEVLTRYLAKELGPRRIAVNTLAPGAIATDFGGGQVRDNAEVNAFIAAQTALGRVGQPDDIGGALSLLLDDEAGWINGQRIEVSGGISL
ncbi:MAG: SDR family oxidoreductase [Solidesulfovibrio sp.]|jgi:NAD(P)-dependent dehydrogenase (short-subunit alcohol dehydrogenase family)|uniref:SDR family NAD(P)-dependent oxidoreductase n=1 Tax=Solidesulfovibrio sp. TaxID=2910990 RepID=UPI002B1F88AE|nr:SDR family oxidoreductase [Solidesulfovibrio sp.]MEA4857682.1 SDR family oxidoreductase [Solidesulfovibrio sp.]